MHSYNQSECIDKTPIEFVLTLPVISQVFVIISHLVTEVMFSYYYVIDNRERSIIISSRLLL